MTSSSSSPRAKRLAETIGWYTLSIVVALVLSALLVRVSGGSALDVLGALLDGSVLRPGRWGLTLGAAAPLLLVALGTIVSTRTGLINIGQEGQVLVGAALAAFVGVRLGAESNSIPGWLALVSLLVAGIVGGALWASIAGGLSVWRGVPEVLSTLLLVSVAANVVGFGLSSERMLLAPAERRASRNAVSEQLAERARIPRVSVFGGEFPLSVLLGLVLAALLTLVLARTVFGFRLRMLGQSERVAHRSGVDASRYKMAAMALSGGFAGLAGAVMLAGGDFGNYQFVPGFSAGIGWTGLLVALVARERAMAAILVSLLFAGLRTGSGFLAATGVERKITSVIQALLVLAFLVPPALLYLRDRKRAVRPTTVPPETLLTATVES